MRGGRGQARPGVVQLGGELRGLGGRLEPRLGGLEGRPVGGCPSRDRGGRAERGGDAARAHRPGRRARSSWRLTTVASRVASASRARSLRALVGQLALAGEPGLGDGPLLVEPGGGGPEQRARRPRPRSTPSSAQTASTWAAARSAASACCASAASTRSASGSTGAARRCASSEAASRLRGRLGGREVVEHLLRRHPSGAGRGDGARLVERLPVSCERCGGVRQPRHADPRARATPRVRRPAAQRSREPSSATASRSCRSHSSGTPTPGGLLEPVDHPRALVVVGPTRAAELEAPLDQPALDLLEPAGAEQPLQHGVALGGAGAQEGLEASLGQHRHLGELGAGHPEQPGDELAGLVEPVGQRDPLAVPLLLDDDVGLDPGGAAAASLGPVPGRGAGEPEGPAADAEPQHHAAARRAGRPGRCAGGGRCAGRRAPRRRARSRRRRARSSCRTRCRR